MAAPAPRAPKVLAFAGSSREGSLNKKLVRAAAAVAENAGAEVTFVDLADYPMPLYDGDDEDKNGLPENAKKFRALMKSHDAFLIASPEYNGALSGLLKNVIDWASRPVPDEKPLECFEDKTCALLAASPGRLGGIRGLPALRVILSGIGTNVLARDFCLHGADEAFAGDGSLKNEPQRAHLERVVNNLVNVTSRLID